MKKTLTINLGGTVYHIDEDAYVLLDNYLKNLRYHFRKEVSADEIVRDMETRIAELFDEYIHGERQVITLKDVEAVIARMGKPEDLREGEEAYASSENSEKDCGKERGTRRLFRNPDDRILGGVASGLAAYCGWDPTWVRVALILAGCFINGLIVAYLIAWIVIPLASTATEKLQMKGKPINVENIGKTVTDGFEKVNNYVRSEQPRSLLHQLGKGVVAVIGFLLKLFLIMIAVCCIPVLLFGLIMLFALLMAATGIIVSVPATFYHALPYIDWSLINAASGTAIGLSICGLLAVGIPLVGFVQLIMQSFGCWKPMTTTTKVILILLWIVSIGVGLIFMLQAPFMI